MKFTKFETLWKSVKLYDIERISKLETSFFNKTGLVTDLSDIFNLEDELITILKDGSIKKTIVYISEIKSWYLEKYSYPKFHIFNCKTLIQMRNHNREERYRKTLREDNTFLMVISGERSSKTSFISLEICGNCLIKYNYKYNMHLSKNQFNIKKYKEISLVKEKYNSSDNLDSFIFEDDLETLPMFYAKNWKEISNEMKKKQNYICEKCKIDLKKAKKFLHTHHSDSNISNNSLGNLEVLCINCHSKEFKHSHIKKSIFFKQYKEYLQNIG